MLYDGPEGQDRRSRGCRSTRRQVVWFPKGAHGPSIANPGTRRRKFGPFAGQMLAAPRPVERHLRVLPGRRSTAASQGGRASSSEAAFEERYSQHGGVRPRRSIYVGMTNRGWGFQRPASPTATEGRLHQASCRPRSQRDRKLPKAGFDLTFTQPLDPADRTDHKQTEHGVKPVSFTHNYWSTYGVAERGHKAEKIQAVRVSARSPERVADGSRG